MSAQIRLCIPTIYLAKVTECSLRFIIMRLENRVAIITGAIRRSASSTFASASIVMILGVMIIERTSFSCPKPIDNNFFEELLEASQLITILCVSFTFVSVVFESDFSIWMMSG